MYGSIYKGLKESVFLFKINIHTGVNEEMKVFNPGTVDHFTYSLDVKDDIILLYGLLLDFNTKKNGFIAQFNFRLNFLWGNKFFPFESSGRAVITPDKSMIGFSGNYLFLFGAQGTPKWASEIKGDKALKIIGGPYLSKSGYIFEGVADSSHFLFKINPEGKKIWESMRFKGLGMPSALNILTDEFLHLSLLTNFSKKKAITNLKFNSEGLLEKSTRRLLPLPIHSTLLQEHTDVYGTSTMTGSIDPFIGKKGEINAFILQYNLTDNKMDCLPIEEVTLPTDPFISIYAEPITPVLNPFNFIQEKVFRPDTINWKRSSTTYCQSEITSLPQQIDTLLACNEGWKVTLPGESYIWADNFPSKERTLTVPGIYKAYKLSCVSPGITLFTLNKNDCICPLFIPNAFSPNNDGVNDEVEIFSSCEIQEYQWNLYSRWGNLMDSGKNENWTGFIQGNPIPLGSYIFIVDYKIKDTEGKIQGGRKVQTIHLLR
jgi:gliding motility-associated-like protein